MPAPNRSPFLQRALRTVASAAPSPRASLQHMAALQPSHSSPWRVIAALRPPLADVPDRSPDWSLCWLCGVGVHCNVYSAYRPIPTPFP